MAHDIDYKLYGNDMQFVEVELDPGETVIAEAGAMMYMDESINMESSLSDGSSKNSGKGLFGKLANAGKRAITGESLFVTHFTNEGNGKAHVALAAPYPGTIIAADLDTYGGEIICQKDAFLGAAKGTAIGIAFNKKLGAGFFGGEGFIMQRLEGDGNVFLHAGGTLHKRELRAGEVVKVDTGCLVALTSQVDYDIQMTGSVKSALFGGEGLFLATLRGPGIVWLQSLPISKLADRMIAAKGTSTGGKGIDVDLGGFFERD